VEPLGIERLAVYRGPSTVEVVVVGAGPAGATAGKRLANKFASRFLFGAEAPESDTRLIRHKSGLAM